MKKLSQEKDEEGRKLEYTSRRHTRIEDPRRYYTDKLMLWIQTQAPGKRALSEFKTSIRGRKTNSHHPGTIGPGLYSKDVHALGICSRYRRMEKKQEEPWNVLSVENMGTIALFFNILFPPAPFVANIESKLRCIHCPYNVVYIVHIAKCAY